MAAAVSTQGLTKTYLDVWNKTEIKAVDKGIPIELHILYPTRGPLPMSDQLLQWRVL